MTQITLRRDLVVSARRDRSGPHYVVEDPRRRKFFRLGPAEYAVLSACDGRRTPAEAAEHAAPLLEPHALTAAEAQAIATWAVAAGLTEAAEDALPKTIATAQLSWNPLCFRVPLGRPERLVDFLLPAARRIFSRGGLIAWCALSTAAIACLWSERGRIGIESLEFGPAAAMRLFVAWCLLKVLHELGHATACRLLGGDVPNCGLLFVCGIPSPFVDVTSAWRIASRGRRIIVSLAGVYVESFVAATSIFIWAGSADPLTQKLAFSVAVVAGITSIACNLNPLMRFDGYFVLSDWWEVPNLAAAGRVAVGRLLQRHLRGRNVPSAEEDVSNRSGILLYGLLAAAWRAVMLFGLAVFLFQQLGAMLAMLLVAPSVSIALRQRLRKARRQHSPQLATTAYGRVAVAWSLLIAAMTGAVACWNPCVVSIPTVVDYAEPHIVRMPNAGWVREVYVETGQTVTVGAPLCELQNPELAVEIAQLRVLIEQSHVRSRMLQQAVEIAREQSESRRRRELVTQHTGLQQRSESLLILAPAAGIVLTPRPADLIGRRLAEGEELFTLGDEDSKQLVAAVDETTATVIRRHLTESTEANRRGRNEVLAASPTLGPRADCELPHPALGVLGGGGLPVRRRETAAAAEQGTQTTVAELIVPHYRLTVPLDAATSRDWRSGERVELRYRTAWPETFERLTARGRAWIGSWK